MAAKSNLNTAKEELIEINSLVERLNDMLKDSKIDSSSSLKNYKSTLTDSVNILERLEEIQIRRNLLGRRATKMSSQEYVLLEKQFKYAKKLSQAKLEDLKISRAKLETSLAEAIASGKTPSAIADIKQLILNNTAAQQGFTAAINQSAAAEIKMGKQAALAKIGETATKGLAKANTAAKGVADTIAGAFGISSLNPLDILMDTFAWGVKAAIDTDTELGEAAKSMNQTYAAAATSRLAMIDIAEASGELLINATHIQKTFLKLNESLGMGVSFEKMGKTLQKDIAWMAMMENYAGLTAEQSNNVLKYSLQIGKSAKSTSGLLMAQYKASSLKYGIVVNEKDILKEIGEVSEHIKISTAGGAAGLAKAMAAAKGLGLKLNDVASTASSLLDFESSIEKELSAELLLGRDLNLEKARQYALNNNMLGVAEEIREVVGSQAEFQLLGRVQQEALAAAVGLTLEQLSAALAVQEQQTEISKEAIGAEQSAYDALVEKHGVEGAVGVMMQQQIDLQTQQVSLQEKIAAAKLKEKDSLGKDIIPMMVKLHAMFEEILKRIKEIFKQFGGWKTILIIIGSIIALSVIANLVNMITKLGSILKLFRSIKVTEQATAGIEIVKGSWSALGPTPVVGPLLAAAAIGVGMGVLGTIAAQDMMADGIIPSTNNSGYGDRIMYGPEGAISFNNKDTIVAGTNLFKANDATFSPEGTNYFPNEYGIGMADSNGIKTLIDKLDKQTNAIIELASRPVVVAVDSNAFIKQTVGGNPTAMGFNLDVNNFEMS